MELEVDSKMAISRLTGRIGVEVEVEVEIGAEAALYVPSFRI